jgi:hypothetical protein
MTVESRIEPLPGSIVVAQDTCCYSQYAREYFIYAKPYLSYPQLGNSSGARYYSTVVEL